MQKMQGVARLLVLGLALWQSAASKMIVQETLCGRDVLRGATCRAWGRGLGNDKAHNYAGIALSALCRSLPSILRGGQASIENESCPVEVFMQCTVECDMWGLNSRRKWKGSAANASMFLSKLERDYDLSMSRLSSDAVAEEARAAPATDSAQGSKSSGLLLQYFDGEVNNFVDLLDADSSWQDFTKTAAKRVRLVTNIEPITSTAAVSSSQSQLARKQKLRRKRGESAAKNVGAGGAGNGHADDDDSCEDTSSADSGYDSAFSY